MTIDDARGVLARAPRTPQACAADSTMGRLGQVAGERQRVAHETRARYNRVSNRLDWLTVKIDAADEDADFGQVAAWIAERDVLNRRLPLLAPAVAQASRAAQDSQRHVEAQWEAANRCRRDILRALDVQHVPDELVATYQHLVGKRTVAEALQAA